MKFVKASDAAPVNADEITLDDDDEDDAASGDEGGPRPARGEVEQQAVPDAVFGQLGARARFAKAQAAPES